VFKGHQKIWPNFISITDNQAKVKRLIIHNTDQYGFVVRYFMKKIHMGTL